jgi:cysteine desulfuration protein SufE
MIQQINTIQDSIIQEFSPLHDWFEKYEYLITLGKNLKPIDEKLKTEEHTINGCQSLVWLTAEKKDNKIYYTADSDSLILKGMIALLLRVVNKQHPQDIINADFYFLEETGLKSHLSPSRVNGITAIIHQIKTNAKKNQAHSYNIN